MGTKCFLVFETNQFCIYPRRYCPSSEAKCLGPMGYHNADGAVIAVVEGIRDEDGYWNSTTLERRHMLERSDARWPKKCDGCGYVFTDKDEWQMFDDHLFKDNAGNEYSFRALPPGAMYFTEYEPDARKGPDGRTLHVICPDGHNWSPDHPASNCTMPEDRGSYGHAHRCWVRHGVAPNITVDKDGKTCGAGGGSIQTAKYHGFLRNGEFT